VSWYVSKPETSKIEVGSDFVTVVSKHGIVALARILRSEVRDGERMLTLDRLLDRHTQHFTERLPDGERTWSATGAFVSVLTATEP
jgi:hypothetical protein